jgi:hypothetical protein
MLVQVRRGIVSNLESVDDVIKKNRSIFVVTTKSKKSWKYFLKVCENSELAPILEAMIPLYKEGMNFQSIELGLRLNNSRTFLYTKPLSVILPGTSCKFPNTDTEAKYALWISTKHPLLAMNDILEDSESYEQNFNKLAEAGLVIVENEEKMKKAAHEMNSRKTDERVEFV